ncbi:MAG: LysR family transcriptional regulator [Nocardioidaceae bacterium]|nr:LysR family transcriptional regulator [Nocardioidaceae bacterium]MCL2613654.1 LysR family transcriptional regulator [Nocardioidaceae bacterium]
MANLTDMLDVRRLVLLREVHVRGSITAAARALSYTHSAVSQQLALLEKEAGVPLLEKVGRGIRLTPAAEELVQHAGEILHVLERAEADLAASDARVRGTLRLAAFSTISRYAIPQVVRTLGERHPALDVRFRQVEPEEGLLLLTSRRVDVLVADRYPGAGAPVPDGLDSEDLVQDPIHAYLPATVGPPAEHTLDDLARVRWVLEPSGTESHQWGRRVCREHGFDPDVAYESDDLLFHLRMVEAGLAAALLPDLLVREAGASIAPSPVLDLHQSRGISMICRSGARRRPAISACRDVFVELLTAL